MDAGAIIQSVVIRIPVQWNILNIRMSRATGETGDLLPEDSGKILEEGKITEKGTILKKKLWKINEKERPLFTGYPVRRGLSGSIFH